MTPISNSEIKRPLDNCQNNPVNSQYAKLDKSKLVLNNPVNSYHTKLDKFVLNNLVNLRHLNLYYIACRALVCIKLGKCLTKCYC